LIPGVVAKRRAGAPPELTLHPHIKELMFFEGANDSVAFNSATGRAWTGQGGAKLSTTAPWQGTSKGVIAASGQYFSSSAVTDLALGAGDYSLEVWFSSTDANCTVLDLDSGNGGRSVIYQGVNLFCYGNLGTYVDTYTNPFGYNLGDGTRQYVNLTRNGTTEAVWVNTSYFGFAEVTNSATLTAPTQLTIGRRISSPASRPATNLVIEALRIRIGSSMFPIGANFGAVPLPEDGNYV